MTRERVSRAVIPMKRSSALQAIGMAGTSPAITVEMARTRRGYRRVIPEPLEGSPEAIAADDAG
jgi:hypothetical protein